MKILLILLFLPLLAIRFLRWLAIVQQKEYRFDRLWAFLQTEEGQNQLLKIVPQKADLTKTGLKRPVITPRVLSVAGVTSLLILFKLYLLWQLQIWLLVVALFLLLCLLPIYIFIGIVPSMLGFCLISKKEQYQAKNLIRKHQPFVIGITGSYGKTSTKLLLQHVLAQHQPCFASQKSFNTRYSLPKDINQRYQGEEWVVLEYAAYKPGEIAALAELFPPDLAVITGLTVQHLAIFKSKENIVRAKAELVKALPQQGKVFINGQDPGTLQIAEAGQADLIKVFTDLSELQNICLNSQGELSFTWKEKEIQTQLIGEHYLAAVQACITVGEELGLSDEEIRQGLESFAPPEYMVQTVELKTGTLVIDDGRSCNPVGFKAALNLAEKLQRIRQKRVVLATAGIVDLAEKEVSIHLDLAKQAQDFVQQVFYFGQPGQEQFKQVFTDSLFTDREKIKQQLASLGKDDILLLEGKIPLDIKKFIKGL